MTGYNFTDRVRRTLQLAREEASELKHPYVGAEHILLGVLAEGEGVASAILTSLNVDREALRKAVKAAAPPGKGRDIGPDLPYTSRAKKVLEFAMSEASQHGHSYVGTEHLLLGLARTDKTISAAALTSAGITVERARAEMVRLLGSNPNQPPRSTHDPLAQKALLIAIAALLVALVALVVALTTP